MVKSNSEYKSIQKKLVAAVAMVLVASIMVVSSSYAWFTLSTAPEVTGIDTSVGANGNLEIALRQGALTEIGNSTGATFPAANNSWGNLIDLSNEMYHLNDITLLPSALTAEEQTAAQYVYATNAETGNYVNSNGEEIKVDNAAFSGDYASLSNAQREALQTSGVLESYTPAVYNFGASSTHATNYIMVPTYGADGRISDFNSNSVITTYANGGFPKTPTGAYGVRAIGTASGLSAAEMAMLNARKAVSSAQSTARNGAISSLNTDAVKIANIAVKEKMGNPITNTDKTNVQNAINNLKVITAALDDALRSSVVALGVSQGKVVDKTAVFDNNGKISTSLPVVWTLAASDEGVLETDENYVSEEDAFDYSNYKTMLETAKAKITDMDADLAAAQDALDNLTTIDADGLIAVAKNFLDPDAILIEGKTIEQHGGATGLAGAFMASGGATITIVNGLYHDIALFVGNYTTPATMHVEGTYAGETINMDVTVHMETDADMPNEGWYLETIYSWLTGLKVNEEASTSVIETLSDLYAYAIDLAFRTNASNSNLLLQTAPKNRVDTSEVTQGGGSYMEFTSGHPSFTIAQMASLMKNIRVVFIDTDTAGTPILAVAGLNVATEKVQATNAAGNKLYYVVDEDGKVTENTTTETTNYLVYVQAEDANGQKLYIDPLGNYTTSASGNDPLYDTPSYSIIDAEAKKIRAELVLYDFSIEGTGKVVLGDPLEKQTITALTQNVVKGISAMVYLDGNEVKNADVAIGGNSLTGKLNLQFASDATLEPMDYTFGDQLATPEVTISGDTLSITHVKDATSYKISIGNTSYVHDFGESLPAEGAMISVEIPEDVPAGTYEIEIVAAAQGYLDSNKATVTYVKAATENNTGGGSGENTEGN